MKIISIYRPFVSAVILFAGIYINGHANPLKLLVIDQESGDTVPARVLIKDSDGICYFPEGSVLLKIASETWFMSDGETEIDLPVEKFQLRVERGKEYYRIKDELKFSGEDTLKKKVVIRRWINMRNRGYFSGETHLHRSAEDVAALCAAENLDFGTVLQWWNRPRFGVPEGNGNKRILSFGGQKVPMTVYDAEIEEDWGALYLINLSNPLPFLNDKEMPNLIAAKYGKKKSALNCYQGGWSREVLVDALLGFVDVVNVCNNNFHMHRFQPRSIYSNLLNVEDFPAYPDTPEGMMQMNTDTYYRLLNCGIKVAAGAGSATGVKEVPAGYNRAYVRCSSGTDLDGFLNNLKAGMNFVTNGPMLFFKVNKDLQPGDSLDISGKQKFSYEFEVYSDSPLTDVEIIKNGKVIKRYPINNNLSFKGRGEFEISESSWICARARDTDLLLSERELALYKSPPGRLNQEPSRLRFAHTSPIHITIDNKAVTVKKSIYEGFKIIAAFERFAATTVSEEYRDEILDATQKAKKILENRMNL